MSEATQVSDYGIKQATSLLVRDNENFISIGGFNFGSEVWRSILADTVGDKVDYGTLFAYLFRRFGQTCSFGDPYKELVKYRLTTPIKDFYLEVCPSASSSSNVIFSFGIDNDIFCAIGRGHLEQDRDAYYERLYSWVEANEFIPPWMNGLIEQEQSWRGVVISWRTIFRQLIIYERAVVGSLEAEAFRWNHDMCSAYSAIEAEPPTKTRNEDWSSWSDEDPLKEYIAAAKAVLTELLRPVYIRDVAINACGIVKYFPRGGDCGEDQEDIGDGSADYASSSGYAFGRVANEVPEQMCVLLDLVSEAGNGDAAKGIAEIINAYRQSKLGGDTRA